MIKMIVGLLKRMFNLLRIDDDADLPASELKKLRHWPRFTKVNVRFMNKELQLVDSASFLSTWKEIFNSQLYKFQATDDAPYIIDCGANIGLSVIFFKTMYPKAKVLAFEPDSEIFDVLQMNMKNYGFDDVLLSNKGLWDSSTILRFYSEGADGGRIARSNDMVNIRSVETVRLRDYLDKQVDFLKLDIEGAELRVLTDCEDLLHNVSNLFVEYHSFVDEEQDLDRLLFILKKSGFRYLIQQHGVVSKTPFIKTVTQSNMDILLNISAFRKV